jgi:hypothetical protein
MRPPGSTNLSRGAASGSQRSPWRSGVPGPDEIECRHACSTASEKEFPVQEFGFEGGEEALGKGVVVRVTAAAHGGRDGSLTDASTIGEAGVLATLDLNDG